MSAAAPSAHIGALAFATFLSWLGTAAIGAYMLRSLVFHGALRRQRAVHDGLSPRVLYAHFSLALTGLMVWAVFLATGWGPLSWAAVVLLAPAIGLGICTVTLWTPYPRPAGEPAPGPAAPAPAAPAPAPPDPAGPGPAAPGSATPGQRGHPDPDQHAGGPGARRAGLFPPPADNAVRGRVTDATLARALTDQALAARLIDEVIASLPADGTKQDRKPRVYPVAVIPLGHGLGAMATFVLAVVTAIGAR